MSFEEYLIGKKIDPEAFEKADPLRWKEFHDHFAQMHPDSFTAQKLFLINNIRRKYPLPQESAVEVAKPKMAKPKIGNPKMKRP